jgi:hypothetical protein
METDMSTYRQILVFFCLFLTIFLQACNEKSFSEKYSPDSAALNLTLHEEKNFPRTLPEEHLTDSKMIAGIKEGELMFFAEYYHYDRPSAIPLSIAIPGEWQKNEKGFSTLKAKRVVHGKTWHETQFFYQLENDALYGKMLSVKDIPLKVAFPGLAK